MAAFRQLLMCRIIAWGAAAMGLAASIAHAEAPVGLARRIPWTTSRVVGTPEPPLPYRALRAFPELPLKNPLYLISEPVALSSGAPRRMFVVEQQGTIRAFEPSPQVAQSQVFLKVEDRDFYSFTFHPKYSENRLIFVFSNGPNSNPTRRWNRISRYTVRGEAPFDVDPASALQILEYESNGHNGGDLAFGPDGMLYISSGDGTSDSDTNLTGQKISDLNSGMLRLDVDQPAEGQAYSIPKDNPFLDLPEARHELWAYGFRNPWRIHFDPQGNLWCGDVGQDQWEMIEIVRRGDNFGWSVGEGGSPFYPERQPGPHPIVKPLIVHPHSEARSITGGATYLGTKLPELRGAYIYGDYATGKIWAARYDGQKLTELREIADTPYPIATFGTDPQGEVYFVDYAAAAIYTLEATPPATAPPHPFPRRLSETGLFRSVTGHVVEPALVPYSVNSPLWSDNAHKERFLALPGESFIEFIDDGGWKFPEGTVLVKTFSLEREAGNPASRQRIETRLMHFQQNEWVGYSYRWNEDESEATLVETAGADRDFVIRDPNSAKGERKQTWHYPGRTECMVCHSRAGNYVLGVNTRQMNRQHDYGGTIAHQLRTLAHIGALKVKAPEASGGFSETFPKPFEEYVTLPDPQDSKAPLETRARAYLHANCAQCHQWAGGGNSAIDLTFAAPREKMNLVGVKPLHDRFGGDDMRLVVPGAPDRSVLLRRIMHRGRGQMPPLASSLVDDDGVTLLREWIKQLPAETAGSTTGN